MKLPDLSGHNDWYLIVNPDLFDPEYVLDECSSLQEGLLICHQGEQKKNKVVPGCQALRHPLRLYFEN